MNCQSLQKEQKCVLHLKRLSHLILSIPHKVGSIIILSVRMRKLRLSLCTLLMITQLRYSRAGTGTYVSLTLDPKPLLLSIDHVAPLSIVNVPTLSGFNLGLNGCI